MASLMFATVGQAIAGPLGGALGSVVGSQADALFRKPRLAALPDVRPLTSSYGDVLPRLYGRVRFPGVLVWMSEVRPAGGGKGGDPRSSGLVASMAIALSSRRILDVGRIWADGRQIRNIDGIFATPTTMRIHRGSRLQMPDPAIEIAEGIGDCPAYRGLSYLVFEDLALAPFGNRVPSFNIEVVADAHADPAPWLIDLATMEAEHVRVDGTPLPIEGYVARGPAWGDSIAELSAALNCTVVLGDRSIAPVDGMTTSPRIFRVSPDDGTPDAEPGLALSNDCIMSSAKPGRWSVHYFDSDREYSSGSQQYWSGEQGPEGRTVLEMAATASQARAIAREQLRSSRDQGERLVIHLPWRWMDVRPGDGIRILNSTTIWRIEETELDRSGIRVEARVMDAGAELPPIATEPGRANLWPAVPVPPTRLFAFATPAPIDSGAPDRVHVIATGMSGWRGSEIRWASPASPEQVVRGFQRLAVPFGRLSGSVGPGLSGLWTLDDVLELELADPAFDLQGRDPVAVLQGANLLLLETELLQFADAVRIGPYHVRVSRLLRGQAGTVPKAHPKGAQWSLVDPLATTSIPVVADWIGGALHIAAIGPGDGPDGVALELEVDGTGLGPLAPCHLEAETGSDGSLNLSWVPRSSRHFRWIHDEAAGGIPFRTWLWAGSTSRPYVGALSKVGFADRQSFTASEIASVAADNHGSLSVQVEAIGPGREEHRLSRPIVIPQGQG